MPDLTETIRQLIDSHRPTGHPDDAERSCSCGAHEISDHPRHVAEHVIDRLGLKPHNVDEVKQQARYATAWFDWELTKLEGAQC